MLSSTGKLQRKDEVNMAGNSAYLKYLSIISFLSTAVQGTPLLNCHLVIRLKVFL